MDRNRFDQLTVLFANARSRRDVLRSAAAAGLVAVGLGAATAETEAASCVKPGKKCKSSSSKKSGKKKKCCSGSVCTGKTCKCKGKYNSCGKKCVDLQKSNNHCGSCNHKCSGGHTCHNGKCNNVV